MSVTAVILSCLLVSGSYGLSETLSESGDQTVNRWPEEMFCVDPGLIDHGQRDPPVPKSGIHPVGALLRLWCDAGYLLRGEIEMICRQNGSWKPATLPECVKAYCTEPSIPHGRALTNPQTADNAYSIGTKVPVVCNDGYRLANKFVDNLECTKEGKWSGHNGAYTEELPECIEWTCPKPEPVMYASLEVDGSQGSDQGFLEGSTATYHCGEGFKARPDASKMVFGTVDQNPMSTTSVSQHRRLLPDTFGVLHCHNGHWVGSRIMCSHMGCDHPPAVPNAYAISSKALVDLVSLSALSSSSLLSDTIPYPIGSSVTYHCEPGYRLVGENRVFHCTSSGTWLPHVLPVCQKEQVGMDSGIVHCPDPPAIVNGQVWGNTQGPYLPFSTVRYACHAPYRLLGHQDLTCQPTGAWAPSPPECTDVRVPPQSSSMGKGTIMNGNVNTELTSQEEEGGGDWEDGLSTQTVSIVTATTITFILLLVLLASFTQRRWLSAGGASDSRACHRRGLGFCGICAGCGSRTARFFRLRSTQNPTSRPSGPVPSSTAIPSGNYISPPDGNPGEHLATILYPGHRHHSSRHHRHHHRSNHYHPPSPPHYTPTATEPDRVALIAYADGLQVVLPTYEEAIRQGPTPYPPPPPPPAPAPTTPGSRATIFNLTSNRRPANSMGPPTRQSSVSTSHSASLRSSSTADMLGSTETVANSETSVTTTNTSQSHQSSQATASLRAMCGSLASFDTSSILNTEGVPLLEEAESEQCLASGLELETVSGSEVPT